MDAHADSDQEATLPMTKNTTSLDNFLVTTPSFDEDLFYQDDFFYAAPDEEGFVSGKMDSHDKNVSSTSLVRSLSNDFFLRQLIDDGCASSTKPGPRADSANEDWPISDAWAAHQQALPESMYPPTPPGYFHVNQPPQSTMMWHQQCQLVNQHNTSLRPQDTIAPLSGVHFDSIPPLLLPEVFAQADPRQQPMAFVPMASKSSVQQSQETRPCPPKLPKRTCSFPSCPNRIVQGGLCISHGARRKTCSRPNCAKNVKKAGLCSAHGPARKRCEHEGCANVSVQGGRCIAHGARKRLCRVEGCAKQGILCGMCKRHYVAVHGSIVKEVRAPPGKKAKLLAKAAC